MQTVRNLGFVSFRIAGTDGVSLETGKWVEVLEREGYTAHFAAGELDTPPERSMLIPELHFEHEAIREVQSQAFGGGSGERSSGRNGYGADGTVFGEAAYVARRRPWELTRALHRLRERIKERLYAFLESHDIDLLIVENALAIPMNLPLGMALTELVAESGLPTIAHHHDFSWERTRFIENCVSDILQWAYPPVAPNLHHVVINSQAREELARRRGLHATLVPNVMDFATDPTGIDEYNRNLRAQIGIAPEELFVLQPTRVIPRKGIEHAIDLVAALGERLQHGVALVISHSSGDEGEDYKEHLERYARRLGVRLLFADHRIGDSRQTLSDGSLRLSLGDVYTHADLVTYPSSVEGFGNAFLEAIYYKRPLVVSPYPVYQRDIRPLGFDVLELEQFLTPALVEQVVALLEDERRRKRMIETNYRLASRHFSYELLAEKLRSVLRQLADAAPTP